MRVIRVGLLFLLAFSVLAFGAVEVWSESLLEIGASILLISWAVIVYRDEQSTIQWNPLSWPLLGFIAVGIVQLVFRWTPYPFLTRLELLRVAAYFIIFFLTAQAFRERADLVKLAWFLVVLGFSVALLGIIQHFTSEGTIYWYRQLLQGGDVFGPYVNRNHFAGFIELVAPVGLSLLVFRGLRRDLFPMVGLLTIIPIGALILASSRGGIVSFALEVVVLVVLARTRSGLDGPRIIALGVVALAAVVLIAWLGAGTAIERLSNTRVGDVTVTRRASMFRGAEHIFLDHPIKGAGLGTMISVYPRYETIYDGYVVDHVHNDYIEALAETGILGGLCGAGFLWLLYREARKSFVAEQGRFSRALHAGAIAAVCGLLLHSWVDFNLHIPSNALLFLLQAYLATSPPLPSEAPMKRQRIGSHARAPIAE
ncbi:MAG TPA: O-antigen ligase family protein [Candidatus Acidoferrales bacterium]